MEHQTEVRNSQSQLHQCRMKTEASELVEQRRCADYKPSIWKYDLLESLTRQYNGEKYVRQAEKLKENVSSMFNEPMGKMAKMKLIDRIEKLGLANIFEVEIEEALRGISTQSKEEDVQAAALCFRILRQHGYNVSQDMFKGFLDENGLFLERVVKNGKGMLELFEASHLAMEGESILDEAKDFSTKFLKKITGSSWTEGTVEQIDHALDIPAHWRVQWYDSMWQINAYEKEAACHLLELAKLNFNQIQAIHQKELMEMARWWRNFGLIENLSFTRDRLVESFLCAVGVSSNPQDGSFRKWLTKVIILIMIMDDMYDIYGSLEELEHFTCAVERWDPKEILKLPNCMKICFSALYDITTEMACEIQQEQTQIEVLPLLKRVWADFCQALYMEAQWYYRSYTPTLQEYLSNGWISSSGPVLCLHAFISLTQDVTEEMMKFYETNQDIVQCSSLIFRLSNDLGTSEAEIRRGDVPSSILCYMRDRNVSEQMARKHIKSMMNDSWKKLNEVSVMQPLLTQRLATNVARVALSIYHHGDGIGDQNHDIRDRALSVLIEPLV